MLTATPLGLVGLPDILQAGVLLPFDVKRSSNPVARFSKLSQKKTFGSEQIVSCPVVDGGGGVTEETVTVVDCVAVPPLPVQARV